MHILRTKFFRWTLTDSVDFDRILLPTTQIFFQTNLFIKTYILNYVSKSVYIKRKIIYRIEGGICLVPSVKKGELETA
jgi:hypothetical protein